ncbi:alpha/beta hydrolase [Sphingobacterium sp. N143]|uniref:hypothetical protein n=1 Tax=Sphingobacterium sp. N143 TaxID=2746727 RepID=UPI00257902EB|nr:hypothetical protein [Sphingobacterium sp. N143]MDM1294954.1 alpha/beta hydrolase [Sphingobacterium sp. N143]
MSKTLTNILQKPSLIILSDMWGIKRSAWISDYLEQLYDSFDIMLIDCINIAKINDYNLNDQELHQRFIDGGVELAVRNLIDISPSDNYILGFSIGGYIAWKACLAGLKAKSLFAVSSTRLRKEKLCPAIPIHLFYGQTDPYRPEKPWFDRMNIIPQIYVNMGHNCYMFKENATSISSQLITSLPTIN